MDTLKATEPSKSTITDSPLEDVIKLRETESSDVLAMDQIISQELVNLGKMEIQATLVAAEKQALCAKIGKLQATLTDRVFTYARGHGINPDSKDPLADRWEFDFKAMCFNKVKKETDVPKS